MRGTLLRSAFALPHTVTAKLKVNSGSMARRWGRREGEPEGAQETPVHPPKRGVLGGAGTALRNSAPWLRGRGYLSTPWELGPAVCPGTSSRQKKGVTPGPSQDAAREGAVSS